MRELFHLNLHLLFVSRSYSLVDCSVYLFNKWTVSFVYIWKWNNEIVDYIMYCKQRISSICLHKLTTDNNVGSRSRYWILHRVFSCRYIYLTWCWCFYFMKNKNTFFVFFFFAEFGLFRQRSFIVKWLG